MPTSYMLSNPQQTFSPWHTKERSQKGAVDTESTLDGEQLNRAHDLSYTSGRHQKNTESKYFPPAHVYTTGLMLQTQIIFLDL